MPDVMNQPAAEPATSSRPEFAEVVFAECRLRIAPFMLPRPEPATPLPEDVADARALRAALTEKRIPYEQVRRDLGLK